MMGQQIGSIDAQVSLDQQEAIVIDIVDGKVSVRVGERKRVDAAIHRDVVVGGLNSFLKEMDIKCLKELKNMHEGV